MKKADAEAGIRHLCWEFAEQNRGAMDGTGNPSFGDFLRWVRENHPSYLDFRTTGSVSDTVEWWWAQEFKQTWRY
ncbi:hypothetical protein [Paracoccus denitrificans]|uniref:hypothetical protein n=1 Tax=Paracoccus denitrificans TaxID=266 RepID=UPI000ADD0351|nr:hypothetical protein [Paracoccus denitrificans]MBB4628896.1 hypothetical protein [Paracoccus denitrificans]MCU7429981.1 hypothetical protein [Paracoccus denitrificans]QAR26050.1 hypothetical protein EO213_06900 [Paracoccus denitrificans]UPV94964.1 hypothetical protein M0K93_14195 [Paracoccus denitrificans]WQO32982.1 hypothetical protein U0005_11725 [Paracoccus denitrificans]